LFKRFLSLADPLQLHILRVWLPRTAAYWGRPFGLLIGARRAV